MLCPSYSTTTYYILNLLYYDTKLVIMIPFKFLDIINCIDWFNSFSPPGPKNNIYKSLTVFIYFYDKQSIKMLL